MRVGRSRTTSDRAWGGQLSHDHPALGGKRLGARSGVMRSGGASVEGADGRSASSGMYRSSPRTAAGCGVPERTRKRVISRCMSNGLPMNSNGPSDIRCFSATADDMTIIATFGSAARAAAARVNPSREPGIRTSATTASTATPDRMTARASSAVQASMTRNSARRRSSQNAVRTRVASCTTSTAGRRSASRGVPGASAGVTRYAPEVARRTAVRPLGSPAAGQGPSAAAPETRRSRQKAPMRRLARCIRRHDLRPHPCAPRGVPPAPCAAALMA
jgi:hypothetical protein